MAPEDGQKREIDTHNLNGELVDIKKSYRWTFYYLLHLTS